jgi:hypothetical protein
VNLTTHLHLVPRLSMRGDIRLRPNTSSWCGASLSIGYVFMAWCLIKHRIRLHGVVIKHRKRLHGVVLKHRKRFHGVVLD